MPFLFRRRFLPLFVAQFVGALSDTLFKNALAVLIIYRLPGALGLAPTVLVSLAAGLFILPFVLFSAAAGAWADRHEKSALIRRIKTAEIAVAAAAALALALKSPLALLAVLALFGCLATAFGPLKYAILPDYLSPSELLAGNAWVEAGTFVAILLGMIGGSLLILAPHGALLTGAALLALALTGFLASRALPLAPPQPHETTGGIRALLATRPALLRPILGISWFWFLGATLLTQMPAYARTVLGADQQVVTVMLCLFTLGVAAGAVLCARLRRRLRPTALLTLGGLGLALFSADLAWASPAAAPAGAPLLGAAAFLARPGHWRLLADLTLIALSGGLFVVPLYTRLQREKAGRARAVAANNIANALFMVASSLAGAALLARGLALPLLFAGQGLPTLALLPWLRDAGED